MGHSVIFYVYMLMVSIGVILTGLFCMVGYEGHKYCVPLYSGP